MLIGPTASGKSTLAKAVYFFRSLGEHLGDELVLTGRRETPEVKIKNLVMRVIRFRFVRFWGVSKVKDNTIINYLSDKGSEVTISYKKTGLKITFNEKLSAGLDELQEIYDSSIAKLKGEKSEEKHGRNSLQFRVTIRQHLIGLFGSNWAIYIPAGRNAVSLLPSFLENLIRRYETATRVSQLESNPALIDDTLAEFYEAILFRVKPVFEEGIEGFLKRLRLTPRGVKLTDKFNELWGYSNSILKGDFRLENETDKIYYKADEFVKLPFASSGQQEAVWILAVLLVMMRADRNLFIVIEEPEAHLFPDAQREITNFISYFFKNTKCQIIIATHSPYILSSANNLMLASIQGKKHPEKVSKIVPEDFWLDPNRVACFFLENGAMRDIVDRQLGMIKVEEIDKISSTIIKEFDELDELGEVKI